MAENVPVNRVHFFRAANSNKGLTLMWKILPGSVLERYFANRWLRVLRQVPGHILWKLVKPPE